VAVVVPVVEEVASPSHAASPITAGNKQKSDARGRSGRSRITAGYPRSAPAVRDAGGHASWTVILIILTGVRGRSSPSVGVRSIFWTTSMPETILPKTGCFEGPGVKKSR
jgi:hypothetical protein